MDIKPPPRKRQNLTTSPTAKVSVPKQLEHSDDAELLADMPETPSSFSISKQALFKSKEKRRLFTVKRVLLGVVVAVGLSVAATLGWYKWAIDPVSSDSATVLFSVKSGQTPSTIAKNLEQKKLVRSALAFELYTRLHGVADSLKAGSYLLSPSQSAAVIAAKLVGGENSTRTVFIPPGVTLKQLANPDVKGSFAAQGFSSSEIQAAFSATYTSPLLKDKPAGASLEGYIFPETFQIKEGDSLSSVLERSFDTLYKRLQADDMIQKFAAQGLTLHQALTLGSIVQEETSDADVQKQVAQVFLARLKQGMTLGSDVTFIYAARQLGVEPSSSLDSPYNTRLYAGLPPGPIATMNYSALQAVADPAAGDYLFFVAGDDGVIHFSRTNEEHEQLVQQYCTKSCSTTVQ